MSDDASIYLMYHEIEARGRPLCRRDPGYVRYVATEEEFSEQICWLQNEGLRGISVSQALAQAPASGGVVLTFDDGCASDLLVAAPALKKFEFRATFYVTLAFLGRPGYLLAAQVRELADAGFDIGCHSRTHPYLEELDATKLQHEIGDAKSELENIVGRPVLHFSCPGGRWSPAVARMARESGYVSVATSRIGVNHRDANPFRLARIAVMRGTRIAEYRALCRGHGLWQRQLGDWVRSASRHVLGSVLYDRVRGVVLEARRNVIPPGN